MARTLPGSCSAEAWSGWRPVVCRSRRADGDGRRMRCSLPFPMTQSSDRVGVGQAAAPVLCAGSRPASGGNRLVPRALGSSRSGWRGEGVRMQTPDVVILVPGFLGFTRFGGFYYFADRLLSVMRGLLEEALGYPVPVVPCTTLPTESLAKRQGHLVGYLSDLCATSLSGVERTLVGVERIHLIGHSTGGVDAQLLACTKPLEGRGWDKRSNEVRRKIRSVVTISAPHYGTCLADSWLASWADNRFFSWAVPVTDAVRFAWHLLWLVPQEAHVVAQLQVTHPKDVVNFLRQVAF